MRVLLLASIALLVVGCAAEKKTDKKEADLSGGFSSEIEWVQFDKASELAKEQKKPIFFLIHKTWCGACSSLKREFQKSPNTKDLVELSKKFVMVNVEDDAEPEDEKYSPDGGYIPRILFLDTEGEPMTTNNEKRYKNNKYFYPLVPQIVDGMNRALEEFENLSGLNEEPTPPENKKAKKEEKANEEETAEETSDEEEKADESESKKEKEAEKKKEEKKEVEKKEKKEKKEEKSEKKTEKKKKEEKKKDKEEKKKSEKKKEEKKKEGKKSEKKDKNTKKKAKKDEL